MTRKKALFGVTDEVTCSNHLAIKYILLRIIYVGPLSVLIFYIL